MAEAIINCELWLTAMKSEFKYPNAKEKITPLRLLIRHYPDLAKIVFDRCMLTNLQNTASEDRISTEDEHFSISFNYELLDDVFCNDAEGDDPDENSNKTVWDDKHKLIPSAVPYSNSTSVLRNNHPLTIMVEEKRTVAIFFFLILFLLTILIYICID